MSIKNNISFDYLKNCALELSSRLHDYFATRFLKGTEITSAPDWGIQKLSEEDQKVIYKVLDSLLRDAKAKQAYS